MRAALVRELSGTLGTLVKADPDALRPDILTLLDATEFEGEEALSLRRALVGLLAPLSSHPDGLSMTLPRLYTALIHGDAGVRTAGIAVWRELARSRTFLAPAELEDLVPVLLADGLVHRAMISALRSGLRVPDRHVPQALMIVFQSAKWHSTNEPSFLDDVLRVAWRLSSRAEERFIEPTRRAILELAQHLASGYDLEQFLTGPASDARGPEAADRIIEALTRIAEDPIDRDLDGLLRRLREQPPELIAQRADAVFARPRPTCPAGARARPGSSRFSRSPVAVTSQWGSPLASCPGSRTRRRTPHSDWRR